MHFYFKPNKHSSFPVWLRILPLMHGKEVKLIIRLWTMNDLAAHTTPLPITAGHFKPSNMGMWNQQAKFTVKISSLPSPPKWVPSSMKTSFWYALRERTGSTWTSSQQTSLLLRLGLKSIRRYEALQPIHCCFRHKSCFGRSSWHLGRKSFPQWDSGSDSGSRWPITWQEHSALFLVHHFF